MPLTYAFFRSLANGALAFQAAKMKYKAELTKILKTTRINWFHNEGCDIAVYTMWIVL
jgi:hypothetical protein